MNAGYLMMFFIVINMVCFVMSAMNHNIGLALFNLFAAFVCFIAALVNFYG